MFEIPKFGDGVCLARMAELLDVLAIDRARLANRSVVITGSNGKGSSAAFCARIARSYGLRTGMFTSPHLFRFNERFQIDGTPIGDDDLKRLIARVAAAIAEISRQSGEKFGAFEAMFALACLYFQESECEFMVFEAGIGGRYDPVRLVGSSVASVTSVDFEHVKLLGNSLQEIVSDKSDACACGGTIVYGENCRDLRPHILQYNGNRAITSLFVRDEIQIADENISTSGQRFDFGFGGFEFHSLHTNLLGAFQFNNAAIAIALFLLWLDRAACKKSGAEIETAVRSALRETSWSGRLEVISDRPLTVVDVGHTPDAIRQSLASLKRIYGMQDWILVVGVSVDKKFEEILSALAPAFETIVCTRAHHKGTDASVIAAACRKFNLKAKIHLAPTIGEAFKTGRALATPLRQKIYVAGGLFTAIEFAAIARGMSVDDLAFF
jgi:dihydrofolate synthase / folylpolyglutamate synthase